MQVTAASKPASHSLAFPLSAPKLVCCDWTLGIESNSSALKVPMQPFVVASLTLQHPDLTLEVRRVEMSLAAMAALQESLVEAERALERA